MLPTLAKAEAFVPALQLRGVRPQTSTRLEYDLAGVGDGLTHLAFVTITEKLSQRFVVGLRWAPWVTGPTVGAARGMFSSNPQVMGSFLVVDRGFWAHSVTLALALPTRSPADSNLTQYAAATRSYMDNALFGPFDLGVLVGTDGIWQRGRTTVQAELNVIQSIRIKEHATAYDAAKTNMTMAAFVGQRVVGRWDMGAELRYQIYVSTPDRVASDPTGNSRDHLNLAIGSHFTQPLSKNIAVRPGVWGAWLVDRGPGQDPGLSLNLEVTLTGF